MFDQPIDVLLYRDLEVRQLGRQVELAVQQLRAGDFRAADACKLKGTGLYRARLDDRNRLLFKFGEHGGRRVLLVLEVVHNHDYARSRFLGGGEASDEDFEPVPAGPTPDRSPAGAWKGVEAERMAYLNPSSTVLHVLDKPLSFDDAQAAVFGTPLPLIVIGSAGSGKTALTLEKLKTLPGHGLYLTRSSFLVESARSLYYAHRYANDGQEVDFLSLAELVETIQVPAGREARWPDFAAWFERHRAAFRLREPHRVFEEVTGVLTGSAEQGPHLGEDEYLALGVRQSIFLGEERRAVYRVFERWLAHLRQHGLFDANVAAWERRGRATERYDFLVIDEVQDVTPVELRLALATLRDKQAFLLCGDSNQIVHPNLFSWARVKSLFHGDDERRGPSPLDRIHLLSANYRNTRAVTALANRLLLVKQRRFGSVDRESNYLVECVSGEEGRVELVADGPGVRAELDGRTRRSARTAVVVLRDEDKPGARAAFSTPLLFSVQEAKGLEYENVILFNLVSGAAREYRECAAGVEPGDLDGGLDYARARDKSDKSLDAYKFYVNALYVAMTRAVKSLVVIEAEPGHPLLALLAVGQAGNRVELAAEESSREEWQREARRLELQGKAEQAEQIRRDILEVRPVPWPVADAAALPGLRTRALGPGALDKAAQQLLFEFAVTYDAPALLPRLVAAGFRHARKAESGLRLHRGDPLRRVPAAALATPPGPAPRPRPGLPQPAQRDPAHGGCPARTARPGARAAGAGRRRRGHRHGRPHRPAGGAGRLARPARRQGGGLRAGVGAAGHRAPQGEARRPDGEARPDHRRVAPRAARPGADQAHGGRRGPPGRAAARRRPRPGRAGGRLPVRHPGRLPAPAGVPVLAPRQERARLDQSVRPAALPAGAARCLRPLPGARGRGEGGVGPGRRADGAPLPLRGHRPGGGADREVDVGSSSRADAARCARDERAERRDG